MSSIAKELPHLFRRMNTGLVAGAVMLTACGGGSPSPVQPSPTPPTTQPNSSSSVVTNWIVTQRFASVSGPDNCWVREQRQRLTGIVSAGLDMVVTRLDRSITIESRWFDTNYAGTANGGDFTATGTRPLEVSSGRTCPDGTVVQQMPGVSNLSGRFAADDQQLTTTEVNTYRLTSGESVTYTWNWEARRQN